MRIVPKIRTGVVLLASCLVLFVESHGQTFELGARAGMNTSYIRGDDNEKLSEELKMGATGGLFTTIHISGAIALQPEVLFSPKGNNNFDDDSDVQLNLNYVDVPVALQWWVAENFALFAGTNFGFLMRAKEKSADESKDIRDQFVFSEMSAFTGLEYRGDSGLGFFVRYNHGFTDISKKDFGELKNSFASIGLSYAFL